MTALHHHEGAAPMPCRSRTGRFMRASRQLADKLDDVDLKIENAFAELRSLGGLLDRAASGTLKPGDADELRVAQDVMWSALDKISDKVGDVRELVGVADA